MTLFTSEHPQERFIRIALPKYIVGESEHGLEDILESFFPWFAQELSAELERS